MRLRTAPLVALAICLVPLFAVTNANAQDARYLASNCANCHGTNGKSAQGMPSLAGMSADALSASMKAFKDGTRSATIMHQIAKGYSDEQIAALASFFAQQK